MAELTLAINGMSCGHCVSRVTKALAAVPGVRVKSVDVGRAVVETEDPAGAKQVLIDAIDKAGYDVRAEG